MVRSMPLRTVASPAAFLNVLTMLCMSIIGSGMDIVSGGGATVGLGERCNVFTCLLAPRAISHFMYGLQFPVQNFQRAREARRQTLVMRNHDDGLALFRNQVLEHPKDMF